MRGDRREFLKASLAAAVFGLGRGLEAAEPAGAKRPALPPKSTVIQTQGKRSIENGRLNEEAVREMLDRSMIKLAGCEQAADAWKTIAAPADRVAIKVNCIGRRNLSTHPEVVAAIVAGLKSAGVDPENVVVIDREEGELNDGGFRPAAVGGVRCQPINDYSPKTLRYSFGSTRLARCLEEITVLINVPVLKDHQIAGVTIAMKNLSHGLCENPMDFHANGCDPAIAHIFGSDEIQKKLRLSVCDAIIAACDGGPSGMTSAAKWPCGTLLVAQDAVALDRIGMDLIEARRRQRGLMPLARRGPPRHIITAGKMGLGHYMMEKIELVRMEV